MSFEFVEESEVVENPRKSPPDVIESEPSDDDYDELWVPPDFIVKGEPSDDDYDKPWVPPDVIVKGEPSDDGYDEPWVPPDVIVKGEPSDDGYDEPWVPPDVIVKGEPSDDGYDEPWGPPDAYDESEISTGESKIDNNSTSEDAEIKDAKGGRYGDLMQQEGREGQEVHHMPADSVSPLERKDGPAIIMEKPDHNQTASYGSSKDAKEYRDEQKKLIEEGKFREAFEMDVEDIREKFGDKYDEAIAEAEAYLDKLESEGKIK